MSLRGRWWFLRGVLVVFDIMDAPRIHQGSYVSIFRSLPSWKAVKLLGSPERHPRSVRGQWRFLKVVLVVFDIRDVHGIHRGSYISIFTSLHSWKVVKLLGSPERHRRSLRGCWRFLRGVLVVFDIRDVHRIHQGSYVSIFRSLPSWKVVKLLGSLERHPRSLRGRWRFLRGVLVVFDIRDVPMIHQISTFL
jgi:hypothetical protein